METDIKNEESKDERLKNLVVGVIVVAIVLLGTYFYFFRSGHLSEQSSDWGGFGDYFNGLISPAIGFITIVLLYRTYKSQKDELRASRLLLNEQISQVATKVKRDMLWKSAESVFEEIMEKYEEKNDEIAGYLWNGPDYLIDKKLGVEMIKKLFVNQLWELRDYLISIDNLMENNTQSTDFFRRRIESKFNAFGEYCLELDDVLSRLRPTISWHTLPIVAEKADALNSNNENNSEI